MTNYQDTGSYQDGHGKRGFSPWIWTMNELPCSFSGHYLDIPNADTPCSSDCKDSYCVFSTPHFLGARVTEKFSLGYDDD